MTTVIGSRQFPGTPEEVTRARHWLRTLLRRHPRLDDIELCGSEIVTNAVRHSDSGERGGQVKIFVIETGRRIRIVVVDEGTSRSAPEVKDDVYTEDGHGLFLVKALAAAWGTHTDHAGRAVWFEMDRS